MRLAELALKEERKHLPVIDNTLLDYYSFVAFGLVYVKALCYIIFQKTYFSTWELKFSLTISNQISKHLHGILHVLCS